MKKNEKFDKLINVILKDTSPEAREVRKIIGHMIKAEVENIKPLGGQKTCPCCQELGLI